MTLPRLDGKVVIVTGSTTGIGKAIATRCVQEGASVVLHGLESEMGREVQQELGDRTIFVDGDLGESSTITQLVEIAKQTFGRINGLVNNAAIVASSKMETTDLAFMQRMFSINTFAPFALIKAAASELEANRGSVLNIGSVNAYCGEPDLLPYSMSKGALMTMTRNLGDTLFRERGIRVNQINPGWILTENENQRKQSHGLSPDWHQQLPTTLAPSGSIIQPAAIAEAAVYWLSDACGPISGQVVDLEQYPFIGRNPPKDGDSL